jgi:hypothetical protein
LNPPTEFSEWISLGGYCVVKYQIALAQWTRQGFAGDSKLEFDKALYSNDRRAVPNGNHFFDWLVTPGNAVPQIIKDRFSRVFLKENLILIDEGNSVRDIETNILYHHSFERVNHKINLETYESDYIKEKKKIDYLAKKFMEHLDSSRLTLYVREGTEYDLPALKNFIEIVQNNWPNHKFHILLVKLVKEPRDIISTDNDLSFIEIDNTNDNAPGHGWQGSDEIWGKLFGRIKWEVPKP